MAKSKRSNSPKRSRRGGRRSPKKSKQGVQKKISKNEAEPAHLHETEVEEPDCACELTFEGSAQKELPKRDSEVPIADVSGIKDNLVQFFWESLEEETHASLKLLTQLEEQRFFFGTVAAEFAKTGKFTNEVESGLAAVWKADEAWIRSFLAGEIEPAKPEEPEAPVEEQVEQAEIPEAVAPEEPAMEVEAEVSAEVEEPAEVAAEEKPEVEDVAMEGVAEETVVEAEQPTVAAEGIFVPESVESVVFEPALNKENSANVIAEAVKTVSAKLGEQSADPVAPVEGLAPKDLNVVQSLDLA